MSDAKIKIEIDVPIDTVASAIESALSSVTFGVGYWAHVDASNLPPLVREAETRDGTSGPGPWHTLDDDTIRRGLTLLAEHAPRTFSRFLDGSADGPCGDLLIQYATLGREIYA